MESAGQWIRQRRESRGLTRDDIVRVTGLSASTVVRLEGGNGANRATVRVVGKALGLPEPVAEALSLWAAGALPAKEFRQLLNSFESFGKSAEEFLASQGLAPKESSLVRRLPAPEWMVTDTDAGTPILGEVSAGGFVESIVFDNGDEPERVPIFYPGRTRTYALRIRGDSMSPEYRPGEILIVQDATRDELEDGEDAVIQCDGSADGCSTFKRCIFVGDGIVRLMPLNDAYKPAECRLDSIVRIGKVLGVYRPRKRATGGV